MRHFKLINYSIEKKLNGDTVILVSREKVYLEILTQVFPSLHFSPIWPDRFKRFDWGMFLKNASDKEVKEVREVLELFQQAVCISDNLEQTFALDHHMKPEYNAGRSEVGEWVYKSKYERNRGSALKLADKFVEFVQLHPVYRNADYLVYVPYRGYKHFSLPKYIAEQVCLQVGISGNLQSQVMKTRDTEPMKNVPDEGKFDNIRGAFAVADNLNLAQKSVIIVDDLYHSGATLQEFANTLINVGATALGLVATKTKRD